MRHHAVALILAVAACKPSAPTPDPVTPPSLAQAEAFAKRFEAAVRDCTDEINDLVDLETLARRGLAGHDIPPATARGVLKGMREGGTVRQMLCQQLPPGTHYDLLGMRTVGGVPRPLYRVLIGGDAGVNYHGLELSVTPKDHQVRAVDIQIYATGEPLSATLGQVIAGALDADRRGTPAETTGVAMKQMRAQMTSGDYAGARATIEAMPAELKQTKGMRSALIQATMNLADADYTAEIARYQKDFPNDPSIDLVTIDGYYLKKDWVGMLGAVDRLDKLVGGDPYLDTIRANVRLEENKLDLAVVAATSATTREPGLTAGWISLTVAEQRRGHDAEAVAALRQLDAHGRKVDDAFFAEYTAIAPLRETKAYKAWRP